MGVHASLAESPFKDLGPVLPPRSLVHFQACELRDLAQRAVEFSGTGPTADLAVALRQLDAMRAVLGAMAGGSESDV